MPHARRLFGRPTFGGLAGGLIFWWVAATPTMLPRDWDLQAAVSGLSLAVGYLLGTVIGRVAGPRLHRRTLVAISVLWLLGVVSCAFLWVGWQNAQRLFMGLESVAWLDALWMVVASLAFGAALVLIGRVIGSAFQALGRRVGTPVAALATVASVIVVGGLAVLLATNQIKAGHAARDQGTEEGISVPDSPSVSGSAQSLVGWDTLGIHGRRFVATATTPEQLAAFHGSDADFVEPVRAYVGLRSAASIGERVDLAVRELERAGGFDRSVLAVWIPTGSGWMVDEAADSLELLHGGDTAIVGIQYSYLPSLLTFILEPGQATEAGRELFTAVRERWDQLPPDDRPELVLFGMSLGTEGVEASFIGSDAAASVAKFVAETDGALLVGGPRRSPILSQLTRERDPGSPVWQPVFDQGRSVRFLNRDPAQISPGSDWLPPRIVYFQHPSDPVTFWGLDALWWPPEWMDQPRGFDVPDAALWFPVVSVLQAVADTIQTAPAGFGHVYSYDYANAWAQVVPPPGWTDADSERLTAFIEARSYPPPPWGE